MRAGLVLRDANRPLLITAGALPALALMLTLTGHGHHSHSRPAHETLAAIHSVMPRTVPATTQTGIAGHVAPGERAFSIRVAEDEIVGGFLQSGDHVDVFATIPGSVLSSRGTRNLPDRSQAVALLQDVLVLAVGEKLATHGAVQSSARTVSLSLTPRALARLALAQRFGKIALAIRAPGDNAVTAPAHAVLADLVPGLAAAPSRAASAHKGGVRFYAGTRTFWRQAP